MFSAPTRRAMLALAAGVLDGASGAGGRDLGVTLASVEAYESGGLVRVAI